MNMADNQNNILDLSAGQSVEKTAETPSQSSVLVRTRIALATWLLALSIGAPTTAQAGPTGPMLSPQSTSGGDSSPMTQDGRQFTKLTEAEVDKLSDAEFAQYNKWQVAQKTAKILAKQEEWRQLDSTISAQIESWKQLDKKIEQVDKALLASKLELWIKASQSIKPLLAQYKEWKKPVISTDLKDAIAKIASWDLPPPGMRALAQELVTYFA